MERKEGGGGEGGGVGEEDCQEHGDGVISRRQTFSWQIRIRLSGMMQKKRSRTVKKKKTN